MKDNKDIEKKIDELEIRLTEIEHIKKKMNVLSVLSIPTIKKMDEHIREKGKIRFNKELERFLDLNRDE